jgi:FSR family fosmidomycin resistance protein-like MFS transporter
MNATSAVHPASGSLKVLLWLGLAHCLNDLLQSILSASYPVIKEGMSLSFSQIGYIALTYQICASVFQPAFGILFDRHPRPWYLSAGTVSTMIGLLLLAFASSMAWLLAAVALIGLGSSIVHPEASRLTHYASRGRHGLGQSIFQVGGNFGGSLGPLLAAAIVAPFGQRYIAVFAIISLISLITKGPLMRWQRVMIRRNDSPARSRAHAAPPPGFTPRKIYFALGLLLVLIFSKYVYLAGMSSFYTFFLIEKFGLTAGQSQLFLATYLLAAAAGTFLGGPIGDRVGRKWVIWVSILGTAPFALLMPHAGLWWTGALSVMIGLMLASAFPAIVVYAQELLPSKVGLISGLFFGIAFGIAGIAAAVLGNVADAFGIEYVYRVCAWMPLLGIVALLLPNVKP